MIVSFWELTSPREATAFGSGTATSGWQCNR